MHRSNCRWAPKRMGYEQWGELMRLASLEDGDWLVVTPSGRFDTNDLTTLEGLHWILSDDPLNPIPAEVLLRDYYEPRLWSRSLANEAMVPIRSLEALDLAQPEVSILSIEPETHDPTRVAVTIEVASIRRSRKNEEITADVESGVFDLHLFRDGQLISVSPASGGPLRLDPITGAARVVFPEVRLPQHGRSKEIELSAYAFNSDRVKSPTARQMYTLPEDLPNRRGRAYVISIGVNSHDHPSWDLDYSVADAEALQSQLVARLAINDRYERVVGVGLYSDDRQRLATKAVFESVIDSLAGRAVSSSMFRRLPEAEGILAARPEDLVVISFAGHGYVDESGEFYFLLSDIGDNERISRDLLSRAVSSDELSLWLRGVDAGDMALIIDACHSAASVEGSGFKPAPIGSRGLGQLSYNKGMLVLAASQADDIALESTSVRQGLLTYALVEEGLVSRRADFQPADERIELTEWLRWGEKRVPRLYLELLEGGWTGSAGWVSHPLEARP